MKTMRRSLLALLIAVTVFAFGIMTACGDTVKLSFDTDDGPAVEAVEATKGESVTLPTPDEWESHIFGGWYTSKDYSGNALEGTITAPEKDTTYYAKWETGYALTLDVNGGSFDGKTTLYLREGANLLQAVKDITPTKSGVTFGAWFNGDEELSPTATMPASALTLTAKWKVGYTVQTYKQNIKDDGYTLDGTETGSDYLGSLTLPAPTIPNFKAVSHPDEKTTVELKENASENVFKFYYDRELYTVMYGANAPEGTTASGEASRTEVRYGATVKAADCTFGIDGYRFAGWGKAANGEVDYAAGADITVEQSLMLYAIWDRGYTDRFGGTDIIYLPRTEAGVAILSRGGREFRGTVEGDAFTFRPSDQLEMKGLIGINHTFTYYNEANAKTYVLYNGYSDYFSLTEESVPTIDEKTTLTIDAYFNATYSTEDAAGNAVVRKGSILQTDEVGAYTFVSDEGNFRFYLSTYEEQDVFLAVQSEEGIYTYFLPAGTEGYGYSNPYFYIQLDGAGQLALVAETGYFPMAAYGVYAIVGTYSNEGAGFNAYQIEAVIDDGYGILTGEPGVYRIAFSTLPGTEDDLFFFRDETARGTFEGEGGSTLTLDGYGLFGDSAVYTKDSTPLAGQYFAHPTQLFGTVVEFEALTGESYLFRLYANGTFALIEDGATEYQWCLTADTEDGAPVVLLYDSDIKDGDEVLGKKAEIYDLVDGELEKTASGYYTVTEYGDIVCFTVMIQTATDDTRIGKNLALIAFSTINAQGNIINAYYVTEYFGEKAYVEYKIKSGGAIWDNVNPNTEETGYGSLYFAPDGSVYEGTIEVEESTYFENRTIAVLTYFVNGLEEELYFEIYDDGTCEPLASRPLTLLYADKVDHFSLADDFGLILDGNGKAIHNIYDRIGDYSHPATLQGTVNGTYKESGTTQFGDTLYTFTPEENTLGVEEFKFVIQIAYNYADRNVSRYHVFDESAIKSGELTSEDHGTFVFDGCYYRASYTTADGVYYEGTYGYYFGDDGSYQFTSDDGTTFFFIPQGNSFVMMDSLNPHDYAYGMYVSSTEVPDIDGYEIIFDGFGSFLIGEPGVNDDYTSNWETGTIVASGTYEITSESKYGSFTLRLMLSIGDGEPQAYVAEMEQGRFGITVTISKGSMASVFIGDDWSILTTNGLGSADLTDRFGFTTSGSMTVLGDGIALLTFTDEDGYEIILEELIRFDTETLTFSYVDNSNAKASYYAADLSPYVLDGGVSAVIGSNFYYYVAEADGSIRLFNQDAFDGTYPETSAVLPTGETVIVDDVTYYRYNGETLSLTGKVIYGEDEMDATLSFKLNGLARCEAEAVFCDDDSYSIEVGAYSSGVDIQLLYPAGTMYGMPVYDRYPVTVNYVPGGAHSFTIELEPVVEDEYINSEYITSYDFSKYGYINYAYYKIGPTTFPGTIVIFDFSSMTDTAGTEINLSVAEEDLQVSTYQEDIQLYTATVEGEDGYTYTISYYLTTVNGRDAYVLVHMDLVTEFTVGDYTVRFRQFRAGTEEMETGDICSVELCSGDKVVATAKAPIDGNSVTFELEDGTKIVIDFTIGENGAVASATRGTESAAD